MEGTLHLIAPSAPPKICGVADHTLMIGRALAASTRVAIHCGQADPSPRFPGIPFRVDFDHERPSTLVPLAKSDAFAPGDRVLLQFTNFAYARWGLNFGLARAMAAWRRRGLAVATMFHETYTDQPGPKGLAMRTWQRHFFRSVGRNSDLCLFSIEPWSAEYRSWFPAAKVETLAVGSNIPTAPVDRDVHRATLGLPPGLPVLGVFGGAHPSRLYGWVLAASNHLAAKGVDHRVLRVGPDSERVRELLAGTPLVDIGILDAEDASRALSCCDMFLGPIVDGASSRRGSLIAGLGHGLPCITTLGPASDREFRSAAGTAFEIADSADSFSAACERLVHDGFRRRELGIAARSFHDEHFGWEGIASRLLRMHAPSAGGNAVGHTA